jgi:hypothetical protein
MSESELLQIGLAAEGAALSLVSLFFAVVSAYIVAVYFFLHQAPAALKLVAFMLLTLAFAFFGAMALNIQYLGQGIQHAWSSLPVKATGMENLGPPLVVRTVFIDGNTLTAAAGWGVGFVVYILLIYLTFFYRWPLNNNAAAE